MKLSELETLKMMCNIDDSRSEAYIKARKLLAQCFDVKVQQITTWICDEREVARLETGEYIILNKKSFKSEGLAI